MSSENSPHAMRYEDDGRKVLSWLSDVVDVCWVESIHVGHDRSHFPKANNQRFYLLSGECRQEPFLTLKSRGDDLVMELFTRSGKADEFRPVVFWVSLADGEFLLLQRVEASADSTLVQSNRVNDLVGGDVRHARKNTHHAPLGNAEPEVFAIGFGSPARQSVRDVR